jgi:nickel/cobalt transporter (NicO) family protein
MLGSLHAFDADHLAAVSAFAVRRPSPRAAAGFGARWALGHGAVVVIAGTLLVLLGRTLPEDSGAWLERLVGVSLIGLGMWTVASARNLHAHVHTHEDGTRHTHVHSHLGSDSHRHGHAATAFGALHGLAGTAPVVALLPVTTLGSVWAAGAYLGLFAVGTAAAMALYAMFAGLIVGRAAAASGRLARSLAYATGVISFVIGVVWLLHA